MPRSEVTQRELADLIGRTPRQVFNLTRDGVFVRAPSEQRQGQLAYHVPDAIEAWVRYRLELALPVDRPRAGGHRRTSRSSAPSPMETP